MLFIYLIFLFYSLSFSADAVANRYVVPDVVDFAWSDGEMAVQPFYGFIYSLVDLFCSIHYHFLQTLLLIGMLFPTLSILLVVMRRWLSSLVLWICLLVSFSLLLVVLPPLEIVWWWLFFCFCFCCCCYLFIYILFSFCFDLTSLEVLDVKWCDVTWGACC
jgi:hypothetical protein